MPHQSGSAATSNPSLTDKKKSEKLRKQAIEVI
jgi:hypothetical protein